MAADDYPSAAPFLPESRSLKALREAAQDCRGCPLYQDATQVVFGVGLQKSRLMLVGEQPGLEEDRQGEPFVGPAGRKLDEALEQAGLARGEVFITNAVKHFKHEKRGKRLVGVTPKVGEINACRPWLEAEIGWLDPKIVVALGTIAARSLVGRAVTISKVLGQTLETQWGQDLIVTYHPSASLRHPIPEQRERIFTELVAALERARGRLET